MFYLSSKHHLMMQGHSFWMETESALDDISELAGQPSTPVGQDIKTSSWCELQIPQELQRINRTLNKGLSGICRKLIITN